MFGWIDGQRDRWMNECVDELMNGWMGEEMNGWMNECRGCIDGLIFGLMLYE